MFMPNIAKSKLTFFLDCTLLNKGLVGIASATSDTYVVALAESDMHQGMLKGRLTTLADHVREAFAQLSD